ncbi:hypothetical protein NP284_08635 [Rhodopseudomonas pseudopalustris]|uniref:hypothetical protein n=1 Tax=Rhodopseudomonas pseudopalustris TaxID=1513892 RepID=UPI003F9CFB45
MLIRDRSPRTEQLFSPKTPSSIPARSPLFRDAAIQFLLDPRVRRVEFAPTLRFRGIEVSPDLLLVGDEGTFAVDILDDRPMRNLEEVGLLLLALDQSGIQLREMSSVDIEREPLLSNCRAVWKCLDHPFTEADRLAAISMLDQGVENFGDLRRASGLGRGTLQAMLCADLIGVDLTKPLDDDLAVVRIHNAALSAPSRRKAE